VNTTLRELNLNQTTEMNTLPQSDWLTASEAAAYLRVKPRTLLLWVRQGKLQAYALSGTKRRIWRFRKEDLDSALLASPVIPSKPLTVLSERRTT
jgi:excisionase family DNA binding protein